MFFAAGAAEQAFHPALGEHGFQGGRVSQLLQTALHRFGVDLHRAGQLLEQAEQMRPHPGAGAQRVVDHLMEGRPQPDRAGVEAGFGGEGLQVGHLEGEARRVGGGQAGVERSERLSAHHAHRAADLHAQESRTERFQQCSQRTRTRGGGQQLGEGLDRVTEGPEVVFGPPRPVHQQHFGHRIGGQAGGFGDPHLGQPDQIQVFFGQPRIDGFGGSGHVARHLPGQRPVDGPRLVQELHQLVQDVAFRHGRSPSQAEPRRSS